MNLFERNPCCMEWLRMPLTDLCLVDNGVISRAIKCTWGDTHMRWHAHEVTRTWGVLHAHPQCDICWCSLVFYICAHIHLHFYTRWPLSSAVQTRFNASGEALRWFTSVYPVSLWSIRLSVHFWEPFQNVRTDHDKSVLTADTFTALPKKSPTVLWHH